MVHAEPRQIRTIGGHVGDSVELQILSADRRGRFPPRLNPSHRRFCAIGNHLPQV